MFQAASVVYLPAYPGPPQEQVAYPITAFVTSDQTGTAWITTWTPQTMPMSVSTESLPPLFHHPHPPLVPPTPTESMHERQGMLFWVRPPPASLQTLANTVLRNLPPFVRRPTSDFACSQPTPAASRTSPNEHQMDWQQWLEGVTVGLLHGPVHVVAGYVHVPVEHSRLHDQRITWFKAMLDTYGGMPVESISSPIVNLRQQYLSTPPFPAAPLPPLGDVLRLPDGQWRLCSSNKDILPWLDDEMDVSITVRKGSGNIDLVSDRHDAIHRFLTTVSMPDDPVVPPTPLVGDSTLRKTRYCNFVRVNRPCRRRDCPFAHSREELVPNALYKTRLCNMWMKGKTCTYQRRWGGCHFAHGLHELRSELV